MSLTFNDANRQPIPRCLDYATACAVGLQKINFQKNRAETPRRTTDIYHSKWLDSKNINNALDLVSESIILKEYDSPDAKEAAQFILDNAKSFYPINIELAEHFLESQPLSTKTGELISPVDTTHERIANLKASVRFNPFNPLAWSDLALGYATLGQIYQAKKAMIVALDLGRPNRFILRSAASLFVHNKEPDRALYILNKSGLSRTDPWITSAEISISEAFDIKSEIISIGKKLVNNDNFSPYTRSELASCLGTIELKNGSTRKAKSMIKQT